MPRNTFIEFLEENPKLFAIAKSEMCIRLLRILTEKALPAIEIKKFDFFSKFSDYDLETLLNLLCDLKLLDKEKMGYRMIYYTNDNTKIFLDTYDDAKKNYNLQ